MIRTDGSFTPAAGILLSAYVSRDNRPRSIAKTAGIFTISRRLPLYVSSVTEFRKPEIVA
jgi:hypothetical protein